MVEKKFLNIKIENQILSILGQSHRAERFGANGSSLFKASNGITLASGAHPAFFEYFDVLYVQGTECDLDNLALMIDRAFIKRIIFAADQYNRCFGSPEYCRFIWYGYLDKR